jgi:hypothetical protein
MTRSRDESSLGRRAGARTRGVVCGLALAAVCLASSARGDEDDAALFGAGVRALQEGRAADAIASLEALADRGLIDPVASYDRGLAYALRVRIGAETAGDLGRAAHGFEEARSLSHDPRLVEDAARALASIRSEVARRRVRAGEQASVDPGRSLASTVAGVLAEDTWSALAAVSSLTLGLGLFVRWLARGRRTRVTGGVAAGIAGPVLAVAIAMTLAARHDRMHLREAVIVSASARPTDSRGLTLPGATALPEGARVEVLETGGAFTHLRFGSIEAWVASSGVRELARTSQF